jgi:hypothetical protein
VSTLSTTNLKNPSSASNNIVLAADGSATITTLTGTTITGTSVRGGITSGTAVASTSGTSIDFTSIPSYVKRITVMFSGVSTSGTSNYQVQLGAGSITTSGYLGTSGNLGGSTNFTTGFGLTAGGSGVTVFALMQICLVGSNQWAASHTGGRSDAASITLGGGGVTLSGTLDRVRITTVNGTDTFDAGSINIAYEG